MLEQTIAGIFNQIQNMLETLGATVIGVWHDGAVKLKAKLDHESDLVLMHGWSLLLDQRQVVLVHDQNQVEFFKISFLYLPGSQV